MQEAKLVWSKVVRISHWLIVAIVSLNLFFLEEGDAWHRYLGYAAVLILICRVLYKFSSNRLDSVKKFPLSYSSLSLFLKNLIRKKHLDYEGHNPAASWTYVLIWTLIFLLALSGWLMGLDQFWGDDWIKNLHHLFSLGLELLVLVHFLGLTIDSIQKKRKSWLAMITGKK